MNIEEKIRKAIKTNRLNPEKLGERNWYQYFIRISELIWLRNNHDGYKIEVYSEKNGNHLKTIVV